MAQRFRVTLAILLIPVVLGFGGCKFLKPKPKPIVVNILNNLASPYGHELTIASLTFRPAIRTSDWAGP